MAEVTFVVYEEKFKTTVKKGHTLLMAGTELGLDIKTGMGRCGGNCCCASCHVLVQKGAENFPPPAADEEDLIDTIFTSQPNSRLACQLVVEDDNAEIIVQVP